MRFLYIAALTFKSTDKKQQNITLLYATYSNDTATLYHTKTPKPTGINKKQHDSFYKHKRHNQTTIPARRTHNNIHTHPTQLYIIHKPSRPVPIVAYKFANKTKQKLNKNGANRTFAPL